MRLIDADELILDLEGSLFYSDSIPFVEESPTVDAEPVRHGHWLEEKKQFEDDWGVYNYTWYLCSECKNREKRNENYCPNCGAKMG